MEICLYYHIFSVWFINMIYQMLWNSPYRCFKHSKRLRHKLWIFNRICNTDLLYPCAHFV